MSGKGSTRRPTNEEAFQANFDRIFGKKKKPEPKPVCQNPDKCSNPFCNCEEAEFYEELEKGYSKDRI